MDEDQAARRHVGILLEETQQRKIQDPDYYEFEAHIMFDDAFTWTENGDNTINSFVIQLVETINKWVIYFHVVKGIYPPTSQDTWFSKENLHWPIDDSRSLI